MLGGAFFHMLPESVDAIGNGIGVYLALAAGFLVFFVLEQLLHWHHCHRVEHIECVDRRPLGYLILLADTVSTIWSAARRSAGRSWSTSGSGS